MAEGYRERLAVVRFAGAAEAGRRIAGISAAARIVRELADAGFAEALLVLPDGLPLDDSVWLDLRRLAGPVRLRVAREWPALNVETGMDVVHLAGDRLVSAQQLRARDSADLGSAGIALDSRAAMEILRSTVKPSDGPVSRWLNRPISRRISAVLLLLLPGIRPYHATLGTALLAALMFWCLVAAGPGGLVAGALLFHAASVFDGVDGEIARATFRTSRQGATLDSAIDAATNVAAMLGLAINLSQRGHPEALALVAWGLALLFLGWGMIAWRSFRQSGSFSLDLVKLDYRGRFSGPLVPRLIAFATIWTGRDFCALVYLLLVIAGIPIVGLYLFAVVTPTWILFVVGAFRFESARSLASRRT